MKVYEIEVDNYIVSQLQERSIMVDSQRDLIVGLINQQNLQDDSILRSDVFQKLLSDFISLKNSYNSLKTELEIKYISNDVRRMGCTWNLDFASHILRVEV